MVTLFLGVSAMGPAQAMGTFLRVWRSEWASLSRAQLATCLRALSPGARGITPRVIRRWEEGQPPATTEELEALLAAMRRHGLTRPETEHFRRSVYAACVDRQYPETFGGSSYADRPDVDEVSRRNFVDALPHRWEGGIVQAVARLEELRPLVMGRAHASDKGTQGRRQEAACAHLHIGLSVAHALSRRHRLAINEVDAATSIVDQCFGGRLGPWVVRDVLRAKRLYHTGYLTHSSAVLAPLLKLHDQGVATHDQALWQAAIQWAIDCLPMVSPDDWPSAMRQLEEAQMTAAVLANDPTFTAEVHYLQGGAALSLRDWADVDLHFRGLDHWRASGDPRDVYRWHNFAGGFALARGDSSEAGDLLQKTIAMADELGDHGNAESCRGLLTSCEDAQRRANLRKSRPSSTK